MSCARMLKSTARWVVSAGTLCGSVLAGRWRVDGLAGVGGGSVVYRGVDMRSGALCAIKCGAALEGPDLEREAAALQSVGGGLFPECRDLVEAPAAREGQGSGVPCLIMEWIPGVPLSRIGRPAAAAVVLDLADRILTELERLQRLPARWVYTDLTADHVVISPGSPHGIRLLDGGGLWASADGAGGPLAVRRRYLPAPARTALRERGALEPEVGWPVHALGVTLREAFPSLARARRGPVGQAMRGFCAHPAPGPGEARSLLARLRAGHVLPA